MTNQEPLTVLTVPDSIKMLRETLSVAQADIANSPLGVGRRREHMDRLQRLIDDCERQRPTGPDGKHGDRHTPTCGCDTRRDPKVDWDAIEGLVYLAEQRGDITIGRAGEILGLMLRTWTDRRRDIKEHPFVVELMGSLPNAHLIAEAYTDPLLRLAFEHGVDVALGRDALRRYNEGGSE